MWKDIKALLDLSQAKLEWLVQWWQWNAYYDEFDVFFNNWYSQALKDIAGYAWLDENSYWVIDNDWI